VLGEPVIESCRARQCFADLRARYEHSMGFSLEASAAKPLLVRYPGGEGQRRYFQDAAIRASFMAPPSGRNVTFDA